MSWGVMAHAASRSRFRVAIGALGLVAIGAVVFSSAARLPLIAEDYVYLATVQHPGWWHSLWLVLGLRVRLGDGQAALGSHR